MRESVHADLTAYNDFIERTLHASERVYFNPGMLDDSKYADAEAWFKRAVQTSMLFNKRNRTINLARTLPNP